MELLLNKSFLVQNPNPSDRTLAVAAMFGLGLPRQENLEVLRHVHVPVEPGHIVLITGDSGSGKSTMLRGILDALQARGLRVLTLNMDDAGSTDDAAAPSPQATLVDALGDIPLPAALEHLSRAGLADARLMLKRPHELSDGQRFRFQLARFFAGDKNVLLADEFCATLDRVTAKIVAHQLRKFITRSQDAGLARTAIVATTHADLLHDLRPDVVLARHL